MLSIKIYESILNSTLIWVVFEFCLDNFLSRLQLNNIREAVKIKNERIFFNFIFAPLRLINSYLIIIILDY